MRQFEYAVRLTSEKEGGFTITCRDLPELVTWGETVSEALAEAQDAMDEVFAGRMETAEDFPIPSKPKRNEHVISPPTETVVKAALYVAMREQAVSKAELARRLQVDEKESRRLLDPHHPSKLPRLEQALKQLGRRLRVQIVEELAEKEKS